MWRERTSSISSTSLDVAATNTVLIEGDLHPSAAVATVLKLTVRVERNKRAAVVIKGLARRHPTATIRRSHTVEAGAMTMLAAPCNTHLRVFHTASIVSMSLERMQTSVPPSS